MAISVGLTLLGAAIVMPGTPSAAVEACRGQLDTGSCVIEWQGAKLTLNERGANFIEVTSSTGQAVRWSYSCSIDRIEDTRTCALQGRGITIFRILMKNGDITNGVTWGGRKFPGSEKIARIGNRAPMRWDADATIYGAQANRLIEVAKAGGVGLFRWFDWPEERSHDIEENFDEFATVWDLFKAAVAPD